MRQPLVSIIIPTFKRKDTLRNAIEAAMGQTYENTEIIVVDDNGIDTEFSSIVQQIMKEYEDNPKVIYIQNEHNLGGAGARNVGIEHSKGEYLAFLDDDDEIYPNKIEKQMQLFLQSEDDELALVYCYVEQVDRQGNVKYVLKVKYRGNCLYESMTIDCLAPTSLWLVRKSAIVDVGMFTIVPNKQDSTLILKLLVAGYKVDYVPEVLCRYANFCVGQKITNYGSKNIMGEQLYLEKCREASKNFSRRKRNNIEFAFSMRFWRMHRANRMEAEMEIDRKKMYSTNPIKAMIFFGKERARKYLKRIKEYKNR